MVERSFEAELESLFARAPPFADADLFTARVTGRLDRGWAWRRLIIGTLGLAGGLIGGLEMLRAGVFVRFDAFGLAGKLVLEDMSRLPAARGLSELLTSGNTFDGRLLWMSGTMALLAAGLLVTRGLREF